MALVRWSYGGACVRLNAVRSPTISSLQLAFFLARTGVMRERNEEHTTGITTAFCASSQLISVPTVGVKPDAVFEEGSKGHSRASLSLLGELVPAGMREGAFCKASDPFVSSCQMSPV